MTPAAYISGIGLTPFGRQPGSTPMSLMSAAADAALADAGLMRADIDGLIVGYATTMPHLMLANVFAEHFGVQPKHAHAVQSGGATGAMMIVLARHLAAAGAATHILIAAGENRLTGQTRNATIDALAQVGHPVLEVPTGATIPAYYALLGARYLHDTGCMESDLAELAVLMRRHAGAHSGAHMREPIEVSTVLASRPIAHPLKLLDCCPISDGACAMVVSRDATSGRSVGISGWGEAHTHQHLCAAPDNIALGATEAATQAFERAECRAGDMGYLGVYDSFTATLALLLEATGFSRAGEAGRDAGRGRFSQSGKFPLNLHGGLLSYGHPGVAGGMSLAAEAIVQMRGDAGVRQVRRPEFAYIHNEGGVMSAHVSLVLVNTG